MIEHLIVLAIESLLRQEKAEQQASLDTVITKLDQLRSDPAATLTKREIVIPPARRGPSSFLLGTFLGFATFGLTIFTWFIVRNAIPLPKPLPRPMGQVVFFAGLAILALSIAFGNYLTRRWRMGGKLVLNRSGAEFWQRETRVFCPWVLFRIEMSAFRGDNRKIVLTVPTNVIDKIELHWKDSIVGIGRDAKIKSFRFISESEIELTNVYAANLREVARLLLRIGQRLG
jgi:hypothetical protein